jgi:hypothetical protein
MQMQPDEAIIVWGLVGLGVTVVALFFAAASGQSELPADENEDDVPIGNNDDDEQDTLPISPQESSVSGQEMVNIFDDIATQVTRSTTVIPGGFRSGFPSSGPVNGDDDEDGGQEEPLVIFDAIVRVMPDPVPSPGIDIQAFGITNASSSSRATFELFGPECPLSQGIPCAVESDLTELSPPSFNGSIAASLCGSDPCEEYSVLFLGEHLNVKGEYHIKATFFDSADKIVVMRDVNFRVHSFFVIPESQLGMIGLMLSSFATLVFIYYMKLRRK